MFINEKSILKVLLIRFDQFTGPRIAYSFDDNGEEDYLSPQVDSHRRPASYSYRQVDRRAFNAPSFHQLSSFLNAIEYFRIDCGKLDEEGDTWVYT